MLKRGFNFLNRNYLKWWFRPIFLRIPNNKKILFAGPWVGEFGWELFHWQGFLRKISTNYSKVIICCRQGQEGLYLDFASDFVFHNIKGTSECDQMHDIQNPEELKRIEDLVPHNAYILRPIGAHPLSRQEFIRFGEQNLHSMYDVVFHPRDRSFGTVRNWSENKWVELLQKLAENNYKIACIGLNKDTLSLKSTVFDDFRDIPILECVHLLASSSLVIGPSSGPMHLASLCGTSHLVWTDKNKYAKGERNRSKYKNSWNPLNSKAYILDYFDFDPPVIKVLGEIRRILKEKNKLK